MAEERYDVLKDAREGTARAFDEVFLPDKVEYPDPRYEWTAFRVWGKAEPVGYSKRCLHLPEYVEPVVSRGEVVAHLCTVCDAQLPGGRSLA